MVTALRGPVLGGEEGDDLSNVGGRREHCEKDLLLGETAEAPRAGVGDALGTSLGDHCVVANCPRSEPVELTAVFPAGLGVPIDPSAGYGAARLSTHE